MIWFATPAAFARSITAAKSSRKGKQQVKTIHTLFYTGMLSFSSMNSLKNRIRQVDFWPNSATIDALGKSTYHQHLEVEKVSLDPT